jgi:hypothetical protein
MSYKKGTNYFNHGDTNSDEYKSWLSMKRRQYVEPYLSKGIKVCDEWVNNYPQFLQDMGRKPSPDYTIDRINNSEGYYPTNCRWSDKTTQQRNQEQSKWVSVNGEMKHIMELSEEYGIHYNTLRERWNDGIRDEKILHKREKRRMICINEEIKSIEEWSVLSGVSRGTILNRIRKGLEGEELIVRRKGGRPRKH